MEIVFGKSRKAMKTATRRAVLSIIRSKAPVSRKDIIALTNIRPSTVSEVTGALIREGIIHETGRDQTDSGRKPVLLDINPESYLALGIHYSGNCARIVAMDLHGHVIFQTQKTVRLTSRNSFITDTLKAISEVMRETGKKTKEVLGIGLGVPGLVDHQQGLALFHTGYEWWKNLSLKRIIENKIKIPVFIENDTKVLITAERWRLGREKGAQHMIYIDIGDGVSAGLVLNGNIYYGAHGVAGELGHTVIDPAGPLCECGRRGCLETVLSLRALMRSFYGKRGMALLQQDGRDETALIAKMIELRRTGNRRAVSIINRMGRYLSVAAVNLANLFNPELIVVGGVLGKAFGEWWLEPVVQTVKAQALKTELHDGIGVMLSQLDEYGGARGAAFMALGSWFDPG